MTFTIVQPDCWQRFCQVVSSHAPVFPIVRHNPSAEALAQGSSAVGLAQTIAEAGGAEVHPAIGAAVGLAGSGSAADVASVGVDTGVGLALGAFLEGVEGANVLGMIAGNGLNTLRGAIQALGRSDEVDDYLQQFFGYQVTLARTAIHVMDQSLPYATLPEVLIPHDLDTRFHVPRHRGTFRRGAMRVNAVISAMDEIRPTSGDWYSKQSFNHLFLASAGLVTTPEGRHDFRTRERVQRYVDRHMLSRNRERDARRLMQYGMRGS